MYICTVHIHPIKNAHTHTRTHALHTHTKTHASMPTHRYVHTHTSCASALNWNRVMVCSMRVCLALHSSTSCTCLSPACSTIRCTRVQSDSSHTAHLWYIVALVWLSRAIREWPPRPDDWLRGKKGSGLLDAFPSCDHLRLPVVLGPKSRVELMASTLLCRFSSCSGFGNEDTLRTEIGSESGAWLGVVDFGGGDGVAELCLFSANVRGDINLRLAE